MTKRKSHPRVGSDFEDYLREEGRLSQSTAIAIKRVRLGAESRGLDAGAS